MKLLMLFWFSWNMIVTTPTTTPTDMGFPKMETTTETDWVEFKLLNRSMKSIPLLIPGVMNPNLSPQSSSGVSLKVGQEVLFKYKGKKRVLLVVTKDLEGQKLLVSKLLREKKKEIDELKKRK